MTLLSMAPAPAAKDEPVWEGFLALPSIPSAVELGFMFWGSAKVLRNGSLLGEPGDWPSSSPLGVPAMDESSENGDACIERSRSSDMLSGVAGIESVPLIVTVGEMLLREYLLRAEMGENGDGEGVEGGRRMERSPQFLQTEATQRSYWVCSIDRRCAASQRRRPSDPATMRRTRGVLSLLAFFFPAVDVDDAGSPRSRL